MAWQLKNTNDIAFDTGIKLLIYGQSGIGKTYAASTCPRPIIFSTEGGNRSLAGFNLPYIDVERGDDLEKIYAWASQSKEAKNYDTIFIDSLSDLGERMQLEEIIKSETLARFNKSAVDKWGAYNSLKTRTLKLIQNFKSLREKNIVFTSLLDTNKNDTTGVTLEGPLYPGKASSLYLQAAFDFVFPMSIHHHAADNKDYRIFRTVSNGQQICKVREGLVKTLNELELADIGLIIKKLQVK